MSSSAAALELRRLLERRFPDAVPVSYGSGEGVPTGVAALDALLPAGGLPRGRLTVWTEGGGATALLRAAALATVARGERAAWLDGAGRVSALSWRPGPLLLRPPDEPAALEAAEVLLRSVGFALVVVTGGGRDPAAWVRLSRAAREGGGALVGVGAPSEGAALRIGARTSPDAWRWRAGPFGPAEAEAVRVRIRARAMGFDRETEVALPVEHPPHRLAVDPDLPSRRGTGRARKRATAPAAGAEDTPSDPGEAGEERMARAGRRRPAGTGSSDGRGQEAPSGPAEQAADSRGKRRSADGADPAAPARKRAWSERSHERGLPVGPGGGSARRRLTRAG